MRKWTAAYMTLEATLIIPFVMCICVAIIYVGFYQYDRCLMRQDAYRAALFGSSIYRADNGEVYNAAYDKVSAESEGKYVGTDSMFSIAVQGDIIVTMKGEVAMPFRLLPDFQGGLEWEIEEYGKSTCLNPVFFIRSCRQILPDREPAENSE